MLSAKEIWATEEERIFYKKKIKKIYQELDKLGKELKYQPTNKIYINLHLNNIENIIKEVVE